MTPEDSGKPPKNLRAFLRGLFAEIVAQRRWMLLPFWVLLAIIAGLLVLTGNHMLLPAIYIAF